MRIIRFIDIVEPRVTEDGQMYDKILYANFTLPAIIDLKKIDSICPLFTSTGKLFKNVSVIKYNDEMLKVLGSMDYLDSLITKKSNFLGFNNGQQKQASIENRTKTKRKTR